jgi:magnesium transporter
MPYLSDLIGKAVANVDGQVMGNVTDILAHIKTDITHPRIIALLIKSRRQFLTISMDDVAVLIAPAISLKKSAQNLISYQPNPDDLYLVRDVLDKQIIDTNGIRVVRVNDLELVRVGESFYIANVDISGAGLARRMGLKFLNRRSPTHVMRGSLPGIISWEDVELFSSDEPMRLKVPSEKLTELHPADLAEILSDLSRQEGRDFLETLDIETLADTLEEVEPEFQASLLEGMTNERVADVLEEMQPDEAADLLAELPEERSHELLELMEDDEAADVRKLLEYPEDSAGGIMTTAYIAVRPQMTVEEVLQVMREEAGEAELFFYIYVTDEDNHLEGVFSLRELVLAQPSTRVADIMETRIVTVHIEDSQDDCAQVVSKYDMIAVPVIDNDKRLCGVVTADDALDKIIPTAWKKRLPHFYT